MALRRNIAGIGLLPSLIARQTATQLAAPQTGTGNIETVTPISQVTPAAGNSPAVTNSQTILNALANGPQSSSVQPSAATDNTVNVETNGSPYTGLLLIGAGLGAVYLLTKKKKKKVSGVKKHSFTVPLIVAGSVGVLYLISKNSGSTGAPAVNNFPASGVITRLSLQPQI